MKCFSLMAVLTACMPVWSEPLIDPMRPQLPGAGLAAPHRQTPAQLTGLFISGAHRAAVIDGRVVSAGERSGECLVVEILDRGVRCRIGKEIRVLPLPNGAAAVKTPAAIAVAANGVAGQ
jgi:hypothetical protein